MKRQTIPQWMKDMFPHRCCNCGSEIGLSYHHIVPYSLGGKTIPSNIAPVCSVCHGLIHHGKPGNEDLGSLISARIREAKSRGVHVGKPCADYENTMRLIAKYSTQFNNPNDADYEIHTEHEIMEMAGVSTVCYAKCKRMLLGDMTSSEWNHEWPRPKIIKNRPLYERVIKRMRSQNQK